MFLSEREVKLATYPCQKCDQRFHGEALNVYLTVYDGHAKGSFRYVICGSCLDELVAEWLQKALHRTLEGFWEIPEAGDTLVGLMVLQDEPERPSRRRNGP